MLESSLERSVGNLVKRKNGKYLKLVTPGNTGIPDRLCIFPGGKIVFVELKRPGLKDGRSPKQKKWAAVLESLGCRVWRIDSLEEMGLKLDELGLKEERR